MSGLTLDTRWMTTLDWALIAAVLLLAIGLLIVSARGAARQRAQAQARRADWARRYFREGGLIVTLMQRWRGPARLTDRRDR